MNNIKIMMFGAFFFAFLMIGKTQNKTLGVSRLISELQDSMKMKDAEFQGFRATVKQYSDSINEVINNKKIEKILRKQKVDVMVQNREMYLRKKLTPEQYLIYSRFEKRIKLQSPIGKKAEKKNE